MSMALLGPSFDIHLGGEDLMFPHHEDEIAQSEGAGVQSDGRHFVKYWLHGAHLMVEGKKMAKSLGNLFTLRDWLANGFTGREIRYRLLTAHYRETFNFTVEGIEGGRGALQRIDECFHRVSEIAGDSAPSPGERLPEGFAKALDDDLNVSGAWGVVFSWVTELNRAMDEKRLPPQEAAAVMRAWHQVENVFGIERRIRTSRKVEGESTIVSDSDREPAPEVLAMFTQRQTARAAKDFKRADALRDELKKLGWLIEDTPQGARLKRS
jgi:cysteinyl-tRNA synthetase